jgi:hypothetical protein
MILSEAAILGSGMEKYLEFQGKVGAHAQDLFFIKEAFIKFSKHYIKMIQSPENVFLASVQQRGTQPQK